MKLRFFKLMYRLTNDRYWVIRYIDELDRQLLEDIRRFRNENN